MCTLIAAVKQFPEAPLLIAANRDEHLDRPARPPFVWKDGPTPFIAGRDERGGGTWLGYSRRGLFVGVTNRFGVDRDPNRASRGALVVDALGESSARALHGRLSTLDPRRYNAFHLLYADLDGAFVTWSDGTALKQDVLSPGVHIVTERSLGGDDRARTETIREQWKRIPSGRAPTHPELFGLLRFHKPDDPLGSVCVHYPAFNYGTRSSCTLMVKPEGAAELWWAEGSPCQNDPRGLYELVQALT